ncbi:hypothetical protein AB205_0212820 [Aquarana catesbeiana]|uniref:Uncharacterized protein n=1 Tax=Aquarana catesbeiana TaxID=8400 RepID=A0A2G9P7J3_AQUCT|nr:hypothetical protein AB205_0212820 [Aquarana catesbeiana]
MRFPRIQFKIAGDFDLLHMEPVHTSPLLLHGEFAQEPCVSFGLFQVRIQPKVRAEIGPETVNRDTPDSCCEPHAKIVDPSGPSIGYYGEAEVSEDVSADTRLPSDALKTDNLYFYLPEHFFSL